jgi:hypothetical protein
MARMTASRVTFAPAGSRAVSKARASIREVRRIVVQAHGRGSEVGSSGTMDVYAQKAE